MNIHDGAWIIAENEDEKRLSILRLLKLDPGFPFHRFSERLNVFWSYRETDVNGTPSGDELAAMRRFEDRICDYIERADLAVLCMVVTEPGYREHVFYARDVELFLEALTEISEEPEPYPIEIRHEADRDGKLYRSCAQRILENS